MGNQVSLCVGDIVYDPRGKDIGILLARTDGTMSGPAYETLFELWVWEIFWLHEGATIYTESGIINMIEDGYLLLYANS